jgi:hypothetical protein
LVVVSQFTATAACAAVILCKHVLPDEVADKVDQQPFKTLSIANRAGFGDALRDLGSNDQGDTVPWNSTLPGCTQMHSNPLFCAGGNNCLPVCLPRSATANALNRKHGAGKQSSCDMYGVAGGMGRD